ncbi:MAG: hypothetical protein WBX06_20235 [Acidobacteriaceae bacterium]
MKPLRIVLLASLAVLALAPVLRAAPQSARDNNPDLIEVRKYTLTMPKIENLAAATDAINKMVAADPSLKQKMDAGADNDKTLDQKVRNIDTNFPQVAAILHSHGLSTREYLLVTLAFINDVSFVGMKKSGVIKDYPPNSITPENAAFVEANYDKLQQIGQKLSPDQN